MELTSEQHENLIAAVKEVKKSRKLLDAAHAAHLEKIKKLGNAMGSQAGPQNEASLMTEAVALLGEQVLRNT